MHLAQASCDWHGSRPSALQGGLNLCSSSKVFSLPLLDGCVCGADCLVGSSRLGLRFKNGKMVRDEVLIGKVRKKRQLRAAAQQEPISVAQDYMAAANTASVLLRIANNATKASAADMASGAAPAPASA